MVSGYELSRAWFDWSFENPEKVSPNHSAIYFFAIEHCNRLGWREKFGFPTQMVMDAIGIKKNQTYTKYLQDLIDWGFIKLVQKSQNQYSANIISLVCAKPKNGKALGKAIMNHAAKQTEIIGQTNSTIDKPLNQLNHITYRSFKHLSISIEEKDKLIEEGFSKSEIDYTLDSIENHKNNKNYTSLLLTCRNWMKRDRKLNPEKEPVKTGYKSPAKIDFSTLE